MIVPSDLLPLYAVGALDGAETMLIEQALATDSSLRAELFALTEVQGILGAALAPVVPDPAVRARLLASIEAPRGLAERVAELFDVAVEHARSVLGWVDEPARW